MKGNNFWLLVLFFLLAIIVRFLYFPGDIYFGFDQARDAFAVQQLLGGHLKIVGPPTGVEGLFHGPLYYYLYAPFYFLGAGNPEWASAFLRVVNASVIFLVFGAGWVIFNHRVGLLSALIFAISFEQTQYALFFNHPSLAVFSVTLFYLGLSLFFFRKKNWGFILAALGLGLSMQFEFVLIYLFAVLVLLLIIFRKQFMSVKRRTLLWSILALLITGSTFILAEIKFNFRSWYNLTAVVNATGSGVGITGYLSNIYLISSRFISDNLLSYPGMEKIIWLVLLAVFLLLLKDKNFRVKLIFLGVWIFGGIIPYLNNRSTTPLYYYSVGASIGLLIFYSFLLSKLWDKARVVSLVLVAVTVVSNLSLIKTINPTGVMPTINVQSGMLLRDEKGVVDYLYQEAAGQPFAVRGVTMPFLINTTWSYLFEWYGQNKYGYLPIWIGPNAAGFPGNLPIADARSKLPQKQFLIIEPTRGIRQGLIDNFMREEGYFTKLLKEEKIGGFVVQVRRPF